jgi:phenylacetate-CoA ligase
MVCRCIEINLEWKVQIMKKDEILTRWIEKKIKAQEPVTKEKLEEYQCRKINEVIQYARKSPFYQERLRDVDGVESLKAMGGIPFTTTQDIVEHGMKMLCVDQGEIERIVTLCTSGTTGREKRLFFSEDDLNLVIDFFHHGLSQFVDSGDTVLVCMPSKQVNGVGDLIRQGIELIGAKSIGHGFVTELSRAYDDLLLSDSIIGTPIQVLALSRYARKRGFKGRIKGVLLSADNGSKKIFKEISETFQCSVYNHYGITEAGLGGAVDCIFTNGMHPREADLYFEIVDAATGELVKDGQWGEIVFTTLTRKAMPLIRYRTGDCGRFLTGACGCKTPFKRLDFLKGRMGEREKAFQYPFQILDLDEVLFRFPALIDYRAEITERKIFLRMVFLPWDVPQECEVIETLNQRFEKVKNDYQIEIEISAGYVVPQFHGAKRKLI